LLLPRRIAARIEAPDDAFGGSLRVSSQHWHEAQHPLVAWPWWTPKTGHFE
jgi:hypothetical protein